MKEFAPDMVPTDDLAQTVDVAVRASQEAGTYSQEYGPLTDDPVLDHRQRIGTPHPDGTQLNHLDAPHLSVNSTIDQATADLGEVISQRVVATTTRRNNPHTTDGQRSAYYANVSTTQDNHQTGEARVRRTDSQGETYQHTFKNSETANRFAKLIAEQTIRRNDVAVSSKH